MAIHHQVGTPEGIEYFTERHEGGLFTDAEYQSAFEENGLTVVHDPEGLIACILATKNKHKIYGVNLKGSVLYWIKGHGEIG